LVLDDEGINPDAFPWTDRKWNDAAKRDLIVYDLHIGSFTAEGTLHAAIVRLPELRELGVTAVEVLPVAQSPGRWNWGYDGVDSSTARNTCVEPDDFKAFQKTAALTVLYPRISLIFIGGRCVWVSRTTGAQRPSQIATCYEHWRFHEKSRRGKRRLCLLTIE
jgi:1,4-alpha-glucan branching enzyme